MQAPTAKATVPYFAVIAIAFIVVQDTLNTFLGLQGPATIALALLALVMLVTSAPPALTTAEAVRRRAYDSVPLSMWLFVILAAFGAALSPTQAAVQHVTVWFLFPAVAQIVARTATADTLERLYPWWERATMAASFIYLGMVVAYGPGAAGVPYSKRGAGWVILVALILIVARKTYVGGSLWPVVPASAAIIMSESRTPTAILFLLLAFLFINGVHGRGSRADNPKLLRLALTATIGSAAVWYLVTQVPFITNRFVEGDGFTLFGVTVNSSGRYVLWDVTLQLWEKNPWFGNGPGASQIMITQMFAGRIAHPHNEYLRLLADTGVVGLALWAAGILLLLGAAVRRLGGAQTALDRAVHCAAVLALLLVLAGSITDNVTITVFHMILIGTMVGLSMARGEVQQQVDTPPAWSALDAR